MSHQVKAYLLTCLTILFWSTSASAFKIALRSINPSDLLFFASGFSAVILLIILCAQGKLGAMRRLSIAELRFGLFLGLLNPFLYYLILFKAYALLPGQIAMALNYGWPLVLTLLAVPLLHQRLSCKQLLAIIISFMGAIIIATQGKLTFLQGTINLFGVALALGSTLIWALYWLLNVRDHIDPTVKLFLGFCSGTLCSFLFNAINGHLGLPTVQTIGALLYIALFEMSVTFVLWFNALKLSTVTAQVGNLIYITPFLSLIFLHFVIHEQIHGTTYLGLIIIVASIMYQTALQHKQKTPRRMNA